MAFYYNNKARMTAIDNIEKLIIKLAETKPTEKLTLPDIENTIYYLTELNKAVKREAGLPY